MSSLPAVSSFHVRAEWESEALGAVGNGKGSRSATQKFDGGSHALFSSRPDPTHQHGQTRLRRLREDRRYLGPSAPVPGVRPCGLLRFLEKQTRDKTLSPQQAPSDSLD